MRTLTPLEARVLAVLVEKQHTVPDAYPLSVNALTSGCNQKTARSPVMNVTDADVLTTVDDLKRLSLVFEGSSSRVPRFEHNMNRVLGIPSQAAALLTTLMLRGPQTAAELRLNAARLHGFADISSVEAFLDELAANEPPRVVKLPRTPGERESRWAHLLCGEVSVSVSEVSGGGSVDDSVSYTEFEILKATTSGLVRSWSACGRWLNRWRPNWGSPSIKRASSRNYYAMPVHDGEAASVGIVHGQRCRNGASGKRAAALSRRFPLVEFNTWPRGACLNICFKIVRSCRIAHRVPAHRGRRPAIPLH